jgi:outer membrane protein
MKRFLLTGLTVAAGLLFSAVSPASAQATKFAFINSQKILAEAPGTGEAQKAFEADMARYRAQVDSLEQALEKAQQDYGRQQATLSEQAKRERQQQLQQQFATYQQRVAELEQVAQRRQAELVQPIMKRVTEVIEEIRKQGNYGMIFDASAGSLITADPSLDLTDRVLERLRTTAATGQ